MNIWKNLLLGSASVLAVAAAQAADLPVKAKPVQYVKICTLYGDGFYYIPGSDTCVKFSGYVRADYGYSTNNNGTDVGNSGSAGTNDRNSPNFSMRHRARFEFDVRTQTAYGTLRNFEAMQIEQSTYGGFAATMTRGFVQWAGFTFGHTQSLSDTWDLDDGYWTYTPLENNGSTSANGVNQIAYTWEFGNGMSMTLGADEALRKNLTNLSSSTALKIGSALQNNSWEAAKWPDPYVALSVNQAWGRAAFAVRAHDVAANYYSGTADAGGPFVNVCPQASTTLCNHPDDKVGWAAAVGAEIKTDFISPGDRFGASIHGGVGHSAFTFNRMTGPGVFESGNNGVGFGWVSDGVFVNGSQIELTTSWDVQAGYDHYWTPVLKTAVFGSYGEVSYNQTATNWFNMQMGGVCTPAVNQGGVKSTTLTAGAVNTCSPDFQYFQGGVRTQWNITKNFYIGVATTYTRTFTAYAGQGSIIAAAGQSGSRPTGAYNFKDEGTWTSMLRVLSAW